MTAHLLVHSEKRPVRRESDQFHLGWREYWLFVGILGGIVALAGVIFLAGSSLR